MRSLFPIAFLCMLSSVQAQMPTKPHIILLMCDDLGWGDVGFNGSQKARTLNLDQLAAKGVRFNRFYSASPVCSPTRGSCLTGRNPYRYGIPNANSGHMLPEEITLAEVLQDAGYTTGHFGKWHLGTLTTQVKDANRGRPGDSTHYSLPTYHGFDAYFATESKVPTYDPMWKPNVFDTARGESLRYGWGNVQDYTQAESYGTYYWGGEEKRIQGELEGDNSKVIMDRALLFMENAIQNEQAFFTVIWLHTPHLPVVADSSHRALFAQLSYTEQLYYGTIYAMDEQVGRLWQQLERWGQAQNTLLCFASDNGPERNTPGSPGPFRERKRSLYEGGVRIPAFWLWPAHLQAGKVIDAPAVTHDYLPTIVELLGLSYPTDRILDGRSLLSLLEGKESKRGKPIGFLYPKKQSWVTDRYKLISTNEGETWELYDLLKDPSESNNIAPQHKQTVEEMKQAFRNWRASVRSSAAGEEY
ncbi:MAG: sulfatase-like hydrolase/transferase [Bacteroidota bacterium]